MVASPAVAERHTLRDTPVRGSGGVRKCLLRLKKAASRRLRRLPAPERGDSIDIRARGARFAPTRARIGHGTIGQELAETRQDLMT